jgi:hypothetical protein
MFSSLFPPNTRQICQLFPLEIMTVHFPSAVQTERENNDLSVPKPPRTTCQAHTHCARTVFLGFYLHATGEWVCFFCVQKNIGFPMPNIISTMHKNAHIEMPTIIQWPPGLEIWNLLQPGASDTLK